MLDIYKEKSIQTADVIARDIATVMLDKDMHKVIQDISMFNQTEGIRVGVIGPTGLPAFKTDVTVPKKIFDKQIETYITADKDLIFFKPLKNESRCYGCHSSKDKTRGMVVIKTSIKKVNAEINETAKRLLFFAVLIGLTSEIFLIFVLRKMVLRPIEILNEGAEILKSGRFDHRIDLKRNDEIGMLASCFNKLAENIERSHMSLENAVRQKTKELRTIAELSSKIFKGDITLRAENFLDAITEKMGYGYSALCLMDKETGLLLQEFKRGIDDGFCAFEISLASSHPFIEAIREARPTIKKARDIGVPDAYGNVVIIPILSHQRKKCRELNLCTYENCPAFNSPDERCWLINGTLCRSPQAVAGKEKIYGCLHCSAFPMLGVLIAGKTEDITKTSLHSLEILASEIASAVENQRLLESKKEDINNLVKLHDISVETIRNLNMSDLTKAIVTSATVFANMDAAILWLKGAGQKLYIKDISNIEKKLLPESIPIDDSFIGRSVIEERAIETVNIQDASCMDNLIKKYGFLYMAAVPLKLKGMVYGCLTLFKKNDFLMTDSEKAITQLFASQAAVALNTAEIYETLRASEERYKGLVESASDVIYSVSPEGIITSLNPAFETITGFSRTEWIGKSFVTLIHPADLPLALEMFTNALNGKKPPIFELQVMSKSGEYLVGEFTTAPQSKRDRGVFGIVRDITERKRSEKELARLISEINAQKEFSEIIFNNMSMGVMVLDKESRILRLNQAGSQILQVDFNEIKTKKLTDIMPQASDFLLISSALGREIEITNGANTLPVGFTNSPLLDINGEQSGSVIVFRDLTEIQKLQSEIRKKQHLEAMGRVVAGVAHEIRNPLFGISSIIQILEKEIKSEQHKTLFLTVIKEIQRIKNLIEELLLYSRHSKLNPTEMDFNVFMEKIVQYTMAKKYDLILNVDIPALLKVRADGDKLTQVFLNIMDNALGAGANTLDVSVEKNNDTVVIAIKDNGIGIKKESLDKIFEPFFTTKKDGTGLGLSICKKLIDDHRGTIDVWSTDGEGATVVITLPNQ